MYRTLLLIAFSILYQSLVAQKTYIWCGSLIDAVGNESRKNMTIVVEKNRIVGVENGFTSGGIADKTIDLKNATVTPGWMDMHVHFESETRKGNVADRFIL